MSRRSTKRNKTSSGPSTSRRVALAAVLALLLAASLACLRLSGEIEDYGVLNAASEILATACLVFVSTAGVVGALVLIRRAVGRSAPAESKTPDSQDKKDLHPRQLSLVRKIVFSSLTAAIAYTVLEVLMSLLWHYSVIEPRTYWIYEDVGQETTIRFDSIRGYRLTQSPTRWACMATNGTVQTLGRLQGNAQGFPDRDDFSKQRSGQEGLRLAVFGDSFTAGQYLKENWPDKVEDLTASNAKYRLLNFSVDGAGLANWWSILLRIVHLDDYEVDGLVLAVFGSDLWRPFYVCDDRTAWTCESHRHRSNAYAGWDPRNYPVTLQQILPEMRPIYDEYILPADEFEAALAGNWEPSHQTFRPYLVERVRTQIRQWANPTRSDVPDWQPGQVAMINDIRRFLEEHQIPALVVHIPTREHVLHGKAHPYSSKEAEKLAATIGATYVDGAEAFAGLTPAERRENWLAYDAHWNQAGSDRFAAFMVQQIQGWIAARVVSPGSRSAESSAE